MELTERNLTEAKETVRNLLEQLGLTAYLFEVEPHADQWQVRVECALDSGWQSSVLRIDDSALRACPPDLMLAWRFGLPPSFPGMNLRILATDVDGAVMDRARAACYSIGSLRQLPTTWREQAFPRAADRPCLGAE